MKWVEYGRSRPKEQSVRGQLAGSLEKWVVEGVDKREDTGQKEAPTPLLGLTQRSQATYLGRWGVLGRPSADPHSEQEVTSCVLALGF